MNSSFINDYFRDHPFQFFLFQWFAAYLITAIIVVVILYIISRRYWVIVNAWLTWGIASLWMFGITTIGVFAAMIGGPIILFVLQLLALALIGWRIKGTLKKNTIAPEIAEKIWNITMILTLVVFILIGVGFALLGSGKDVVDTKSSSMNNPVSTQSWTQEEKLKENTVPNNNSWADTNMDFNTNPTKLIDLSLYNLEKSKKLWSEESYFVFDGKGWLAQAPLVKLGEDEWKIVTGIANGELRENTDWSYSAISANGKFGLISKTIDTKDGSGITEQKVQVKNIATDTTIYSGGFIDPIIGMRLENDWKLNTILYKNGILNWFTDSMRRVVIQMTPETDKYKEREQIQSIMFQNKEIMTVSSIHGSGMAQIIKNGTLITPKWKYENDPIINVKVISGTKEGKVLSVCYGKKNMAFFLDDEEVIGNILTEEARYLYGLIADSRRETYLYGTISDDGRSLAIIDSTNSGTSFVRILSGDSQNIGKQYPQGSRILFLTFSPDGKSLAYTVEKTDPTDWRKKEEYLVVNGKEYWPWAWVSANFKISNDSVFVYQATDTYGNQHLIKNDTYLQTVINIYREANPLLQDQGMPSSSSKMDSTFRIQDESLQINPLNGKVFYIFSKMIQTNPTKWMSIVNYEGTPQTYYGFVNLANWGKGIFSPDGKHLVYSYRDDESWKTSLVIDGKEQVIDGNMMWSWWGNDGGFSSDSKWFGIYVMKDNAVWWIPFNLETSSPN